MNIEKTVNKYLYKSSVGNLPTDRQGNPIPALLFANAKNDDRFGDLYLFNNFGISGGNTLTSTIMFITYCLIVSYLSLIAVN